MTTKRYAVVLTDAGAAELAPVVRALLRHSDGVAYFLCNEIHPDGQYFHMKIEDRLPNDSLVELELHIPHHHIRGAFHAANLKDLGFTAP